MAQYLPLWASKKPKALPASTRAAMAIIGLLVGVIVFLLIN